MSAFRVKVRVKAWKQAPLPMVDLPRLYAEAAKLMPLARETPTNNTVFLPAIWPVQGLVR